MRLASNGRRASKDEARGGTMIDWSSVLRTLASRALPICLLALTSCAGERGDEPISDVSETLSTAQPLATTLTVTSQWSTGYCASVRVRNTGPARVNGWTVDIRPAGTLTSS
jgi:cellulase/cellobiase CelA1